MAYDLTLSGATFNASGKFGQSLNGGSGYTSTMVTTFPYTIQAWVKGVASSSIEVAAGQAGMGWFGKAADNTAYAHYGPGSSANADGGDIPLTTTINITDGAWHLLELVVTTGGGSFYVDGVLAASATYNPLSFLSPARYFGVRGFFSYVGSSTAYYPWSGEVDQVAVFNTALHSTNYTPPATAMTGTETGLLALYPLDGNGTNTASQPAATAVTLSLSSASSAVGTAITVTVGTDHPLTGSQSETITLSAPVAGTWSASAVTLSASAPTAAPTFTPSATGNGNITASASGSPTLTSASAPYTATTTAGGALDTSRILFSPYTWDVQSTYAKAINGGAYFRMCFSGSSCTLTFDMSAAVSPYPKLAYRLDDFGPWTTVDLAATVVIAIPSEIAAYPSHFLDFHIRSTSETVSRWASQAVAVKLVGIALASGGALLAKPADQPLYGLYYGDSITEGVNTVTNQGDTTVRSDAAQGWAYLSAKAVGAECGIVGFGRQGFTVTGNPDVPTFQNTWNYLWNGTSRSFTRAPDYIVINQGTNDGTADISAGATQVLNALIAACPTSKIIVLRPFNGSGDSYWTTVIAGCTKPSQVTHVDTTGWFDTTQSFDGLHPNGYANASHIAPLVATAIRNALNGAPTLATRTVSLTLADANGPLANLSGLKVAFYDEPTPDLHSVPRYKSASGTTNASGVLSFTVQSTLASGGSGCLVVQMADGRNLSASVAVA